MERSSTSALLVAAVAALLGACGDDDGPGPRDATVGTDAGGDAGTDAGPMYDAGPYTRVTEAVAQAGRESCRFVRGAMPWETVGDEHPIGDDIPIDHFVLLMQENRSFDHYFGAMGAARPEVDGLPMDAQNPDATGTPVPAYHETQYCVDDTSHSWNASHRQYHGGANDGFVVTNDPGGRRAMGWFDRSDLPYYYDLYETFAMSDRHFCSLLGPTWPNRFFFTSGTSFGLTDNRAPPPERLPTDRPYYLPQQLDGIGATWRIYSSSVPFAYGGYSAYIARARGAIRAIDRFASDAARGDLPAVTYVDPGFIGGGDQTDEHPPADPQAGQAWTEAVVAAVMASPLWPRTAIVLTYDEHGGFYDHVPPPEACPPGDFPPDLDPGDQPGGFDRYGFRVPLVVISPYARPGYVSHRVTDHASVLRLVQTRFLLPAMTSRDANAWPLLDMFDFAASPPPFLTPPTLDRAVVDEAKLEECRALYPSEL